MLNSKILLTLFLALILTSSIQFNQKAKIPLTNFNPTKIQYSSDQTFLGAIDKNGHSFKIFDGRSLKQLQTVILNQNVNPQSLQFSHNSKYFVIGDNNGFLYIYVRSNAIFTQEPIKTQKVANNSRVLTITFNNDDNILAVGDANGFISFFDISQLSQGSIFSQFDFIVKLNRIQFGVPVNSIAFTPVTGKLLVGGSDSSTGPLMKLYNSETLIEQHVFTLNVNTSSILSVASASDQSFFLNTGSYKNNDVKIQAWNGSNYSNLASLTQSNGTFNVMYQVLISDNNLYVVSAGNTQAFIWQRADTTKQFTFNKAISSGLGNIALSPNEGMLLVVPTEGGLISQYSLCKTKQFYQQHNDSCQNCNDQCIQCFGQSSSQCYECPERKYLNSTQCSNCVYGCLQCQDAGSCIKCDEDNLWQPKGGLCECVQGFFEFNQKCTACIKGCARCNNATECQTCNARKGFTKLANNTCGCPSKTRQNIDTCQACGLGCLQCDTTLCNDCDAKQHFVDFNPPSYNCACDDKNNWISSGSLCVCKPGFFDNKNACQQCNRICSTCNSLTNCTSCGVVPTTKLVDGKCQCIDRAQFINLNIPACQNCNNTVDFCTRCNGPNDCTQCNVNLNRDLENGKCVCAKGFFLNASTNLCDPCGIFGCQKCNSPTQCTQCNKQQHWIKDGSGLCMCEQRFLKIEGVCQSCSSPGCLKCQGTADFCTQCDKSRKWEKVENNGCFCENGTYSDKDITCLDCQFGCVICADKNDCSQCYPDFENIQGGCFCQTGRYKLNRTNCADCTLMGCEDCISPTICTTCFSDFQLNQQKKCVCKNNKTYADGNKCSACAQPCFTCKTIDSCSSCIQGYILQGDVCQQDGISPLVIVIIVIGILSLGGAGFAVVKYCKKKRSPLQEQADYQPMQTID